MTHNIIVEVEDRTFDVDFNAKYLRNHSPQWVQLQTVDIDSVHEVIELVEDTRNYQPRAFSELEDTIRARILKACYKLAERDGVMDVLEG